MLTLGISTSSGQFALILGENGKVLYNSNDFEVQHELDDMLLNALTHCNKNAKDINNIIVDIGPGGTSRVRTGVAFANSLSYTLNIPVYPVSSMELAGIEASNKYGLPVISTVKSIKGNAYIGLYDEKLITIEFGKIEDIVPKMAGKFDSFVVVGFHNNMIMNLPILKDKNIIDSGLLFGDIRLFIEKENILKLTNGLLFPDFAQPMTEKTN